MFTLAIFRMGKSMDREERSSSAAISTLASGRTAKGQAKAATSLPMVESTRDRCGTVSLMGLGS
jgi:hypothetical protein